MDFINKKSFCAQFLSQFPSIKLETIKTLCSNGFQTYYQLIGLNIDSDLPFGSDISLRQKALIRGALIQLNSHSDNGFNYEFNDDLISFNNNNNNIIESNVKLDEEINHKKTSIAFICLDNDTDDDVDYEDINQTNQQFIHQKENNYFNNDLKQEIKNECKTSLEFGFNSQLIDKQNRDSNELTINMKTERKEIKRRRKSKELIPLSLIKSRQMPDCDYYKLLKTVRMPYILINRLNIDQELTNKFIEYKNWFRAKRRYSGKKTKSKLINDNLLNNNKIKGPFKCDYSDCGYSGPNAHYLRMHKYRHTGEKHITCHWPGCQFSSIWKHSVREHYYTHTNEKPHKCGWNGCQYSSAQSGNLAKHKRIHFGDKPYLCHWLGCSQKFNNNQSLDAHLRNKHNYIPIEDSNDAIIDINKKRSYEEIKNHFLDEEVDAQNNFEINLSHFTVNEFLTEDKQNSIQNISHNFDNHFTRDLSFNNNLVKDSVEKVLNNRRVSPRKLSQTDIDSMNESIDKVINDCLKEEFIDNTIESNDSSKLNERDIQNTNSFKCLWPECDYNNEDSIEFEKHSRTHGPKKRRISSEKGEVMCCWPGCGYKTKYSRLLRDHQNAHNGIRHHKCNHCNYNSSYFGDIRRHMSKNHSLIFEEIKRNRKLKQMETKNKSKKNTKNQLFIDETNCQLINDNNSQLLSQIKLEVIDEPNGEVINETNCEDINQNEQLISCLSGQQTGELKPYFCGWSGCAFSTIDSDLFVRHRREHIGGELQYHCDQQQCYYQTNRFNSLIIHKRRYHRIHTFHNNCQTILHNNLQPSLLTFHNNSQQLINGFNYDFQFKNDFFSNDEYLNYSYEQNF